MRNVSPPAGFDQETPCAMGEIIGVFLDREIYAWIKLSDGYYEYSGIAPGPMPGVVDMSALRENEVCLTPGVIYRRTTMQEKN